MATKGAAAWRDAASTASGSRERDRSIKRGLLDSSVVCVDGLASKTAGRESGLSIAYRQPCRQLLCSVTPTLLSRLGVATCCSPTWSRASVLAYFTCGKIGDMSEYDATSRTIGILALQGDYEAHRKVLEERLHVNTAQVRTPAELCNVDALVLPGGESTTIAKLLSRIDLEAPIRARAAAGMPIYGTCAGMILLAADIEGRPDQPTLDLMDVTVARNAFGRQVDSFEADVDIDADGESRGVRGVFIRAPYVTRAGSDVEVLAQYEGKTVAVRQGNLLATAFHPELTDDSGMHEMFVRIVAGSREAR
jgi:5'-phosphate synthase pdxT subunit